MMLCFKLEKRQIRSSKLQSSEKMYYVGLFVTLFLEGRNGIHIDVKNARIEGKTRRNEQK